MISKEDIRAFMASGMYGGPPVHESHPDVICVKWDFRYPDTKALDHDYECPKCKARGGELALPCSK